MLLLLESMVFFIFPDEKKRPIWAIFVSRGQVAEIEYMPLDESSDLARSIYAEFDFEDYQPSLYFTLHPY